MRILFAAGSGGRTVGAGHVMRSMAVAEAATTAGHAVAVAADLSDLRWVEPWVDAVGVERVAAAWDGAALADLAVGFSADVVLLDSYEIGEALTAVHEGGALLASFEDGRHGRRQADIVIDYQLGAQNVARPEDGSLTVLRGIRFAPIRAQVCALARVLPAPVPRRVTRVATLMGSSGTAGLEALMHQALAVNGIDVVSLERGLGAISQVATADAIVSASGVSAYELCHLGLPCALVQSADNQRGNYDALVRADAVRGLGTSRELSARPSALQRRLEQWASDWRARQSNARRARDLVDGRGAPRIVAALTAAVDARDAG